MSFINPVGRKVGDGVQLSPTCICSIGNFAAVKWV